MFLSHKSFEANSGDHTDIEISDWQIASKQNIFENNNQTFLNRYSNWLLLEYLDIRKAGDTISIPITICAPMFGINNE